MIVYCHPIWLAKSNGDIYERGHDQLSDQLHDQSIQAAMEAKKRMVEEAVVTENEVNRQSLVVPSLYV